MPAKVIAYTSASQRARVFSERWVETHFPCPKCAAGLRPTPNNTRATDFLCPACRYGFELKAKKGRFGDRVVNGAYASMLATLRSPERPHLLLLSYTPSYEVQDFVIVPRQFLVEQIVIPRKPLGPHCRRAGWQGCNLHIGLVPEDGRIAYVSDFQRVPPADFSRDWKRVEFLDEYSPHGRGWLSLTMYLIRSLGRATFDLKDLYALEHEARKVFPANLHVRAKLRQQLQRLRDSGWLDFEGRGRYTVKS